MIDELAELLAEASSVHGSPLNQAVHLQKELIKLNRRDLANRVSKRARGRHAEAHPDPCLAADVCAALAAARTGEDEEVSGSTTVGGEEVGESDGSGNADKAEAFYMGEVMRDAEMQTNTRVAEVLVDAGIQTDTMVGKDVEAQIVGMECGKGTAFNDIKRNEGTEFKERLRGRTRCLCKRSADLCGFVHSSTHCDKCRRGLRSGDPFFSCGPPESKECEYDYGVCFACYNNT